MSEPISFRETTDASASTVVENRDAVALRFDPSRRVMLRFSISLQGDEELEALRYARRTMIREERTRGLEWDEPTLEDLALAGRELRWFVLSSQAAWGREKIAELLSRANRALRDLLREAR
jgi:hypothetical protein